MNIRIINAVKLIIPFLLFCITFTSGAEEYRKITSEKELNAYLAESQAREYGNKATRFRRNGDIEQAEIYQKKALEIARTHLGTKHIEYAYHLDNMASILELKNQHQRAAEYRQHALSVARASLDSDDIKLATFTFNTGASKFSQGKLTESIRLLEETLRLEEKAYGHNSRKLLDTINVLSTVYSKSGNNKIAHELRERGKSIISSSINNID